eukprot:TRINITY_DN400_c0_g2_i1.p1 TRINITY_DN400_c0_g2~~TRINITY_DN400_c0_g2_i1.p1  ORF type:complete len:533 (+),score=143.20 TRINITY_DN400_c0_g2_i1:106-1599(+)
MANRIQKAWSKPVEGNPKKTVSPKLPAKKGGPIKIGERPKFGAAPKSPIAKGPKKVPLVGGPSKPAGAKKKIPVAVKKSKPSKFERLKNIFKKKQPPKVVRNYLELDEVTEADQSRLYLDSPTYREGAETEIKLNDQLKSLYNVLPEDIVEVSPMAIDPYISLDSLQTVQSQQQSLDSTPTFQQPVQPQQPTQPLAPVQVSDSLPPKLVTTVSGKPESPIQSSIDDLNPPGKTPPSSPKRLIERPSSHTPAKTQTKKGTYVSDEDEGEGESAYVDDNDESLYVSDEAYKQKSEMGGYIDAEDNDDNESIETHKGGYIAAGAYEDTEEVGSSVSETSDMESSESDTDSVSTETRPKTVDTNLKWTYRFQTILDKKDSFEKFHELCRLAHEFVFVAETYGKVIISEIGLSEKEKSIKPVSVGGSAGGEKYIVQGILFKFALDINGLYGSDENAQKAAGHDLKGLISYFLTSVPGLYFPIMALIHYMGFCLIAVNIYIKA